MRRTARSCPTMRAASFSSNSCARGLFWSGSSRTVFGVIVSLSIIATMARPPSQGALRRRAVGRLAVSRRVWRLPAILAAPVYAPCKERTALLDESLKDVVCLQRWPGGTALKIREHYIYDNEFFVTTKYSIRKEFSLIHARRGAARGDTLRQRRADN